MKLNRIPKYLKAINKTTKETYLLSIGRILILLEELFKKFFYSLLGIIIGILTLIWVMILVPIINYGLVIFSPFFKKVDKW